MEILKPKEQYSINTKSPKISIITPNYNYSKYIGKTIESIIKQNYDNYEHIIVDDGSTDNSVEIIRSYIKDYPDKIKLITQKNSGHTKAVNAGFKNASGNIIGWINSDDIYCENIFDKIANEFTKDPNIDIIYGDYYLIDRDGNIISENKHLRFNYSDACFKGFGRVLTSNAIFWKRELFEKFGYLDEDFIYNPDGEFLSRITYKANMKQLQIPLAYYRRHSLTLTTNKNEQVSDRREKELLLEFSNSYNKLPVSKVIPVKYTFLQKIYYSTKRIALRSIKGHYNARIVVFFKRVF
jgi:glycosyltransferase involved in cell wall biosynthesis